MGGLGACPESLVPPVLLTAGREVSARHLIPPRRAGSCWPSRVALPCPQPLRNQPLQGAGAGVVLALSSRGSHTFCPHILGTSFAGPERTRTKKNILVSHAVDHGLSLAGIEPGSCLEEVRARNLEGGMCCGKWKPLWGDLCAGVQESCLIPGFATSQLCDLGEVASPLLASFPLVKNRSHSGT